MILSLFGDDTVLRCLAKIQSRIEYLSCILQIIEPRPNLQSGLTEKGRIKKFDFLSNTDGGMDSSIRGTFRLFQSTVQAINSNLHKPL